MKKLLFVCIAVFAINFNAKAQDGFEAILLAGDDAGKLTEAYISPAMKGLIYGMNSGWYHTAKVHKVLGFDITIGLNASAVPSEDEIFTFANLGLSNRISANSTTSATVGGPNNLKADVTFTGTVLGQNVTSTFEMPGGIIR